MSIKKRPSTARQPARLVHPLVSGRTCVFCKERPIAHCIHGSICPRCAIEALPRMAAAYAAENTDCLTDSNLETARMDEFFEGFGRRFWQALAKFKAHRHEAR